MGLAKIFPWVVLVWTSIVIVIYFVYTRNIFGDQSLLSEHLLRLTLSLPLQDKPISQVSTGKKYYSPRSVFTKACYRYVNNTAENLCCRLHHYSVASQDLRKCVNNLVKKREGNTSQNASASATKRRKRMNDSPPPAKIRNRPWKKREHWVLVGDSHTRFLFNSLVTYFEKEKLLFRLQSTEGPWLEYSKEKESFMEVRYQENIEIAHKQLPLRISFLWDKYLDGFQAFLKEWKPGRKLAPTIVYFSSALHWLSMWKYQIKKVTLEEAFELYRSQMKSLLPELRVLAESTPVIFRLQDHIQFCDYNRDRVDHLNHIATNILNGTGVILWDSFQPLSEIYVRECSLRPKNLTDLSWMCGDPLHTGYVMVHQGTNMLLNHLCNEALFGREGDFCL